MRVMRGEGWQVRVRWARTGMVGGLALALASSIAGAPAAVAAAQTPEPAHRFSWDIPLTVQPRQMATGTHNPPAGTYLPDGTNLPEEPYPLPVNNPFMPSAQRLTVIVPPQCVGPKRCPLVVFIPATSTVAPIWWMRPVADKYGLMFLIAETNGIPQIDTAMQQVLQRFAIDPGKLALVGHCGTSHTAFAIHASSTHVFSRIGMLSPPSGNNGFEHEDSTTSRGVELLFDGGITEGTNPRKAGPLRRMAGHRIKMVTTIRGHENHWEDYDFLGHWLEESWRIPNPAARPAPANIADPLPLLTPEVLTKMTAFWTAFQQEPDSIRHVARRAHLREVLVPIPPGTGDTVSTWMTDMAALAARYPAVAAALAKVGWTGQQHDVYRVALISSFRSRQGRPFDGDQLDPNSVLVKNLAFFEAHRDEYDALEDAGVDPETLGILKDGHDGRAVEEVGARGIWRMP